MRADTICNRKPILPLLSLKCLARRPTIHVVAQNPILMRDLVPWCALRSVFRNEMVFCLLTFKEGWLFGLDIILLTVGA